MVIPELETVATGLLRAIEDIDQAEARSMKEREEYAYIRMSLQTAFNVVLRKLYDDEWAIEKVEAETPDRGAAIRRVLGVVYGG